MTHSFSVIIPARYASTRLPGKPLQDIHGKPMVQHVFERAMESQAARCHVATDDQRIFDAVVGFGGNALMTLSSHPSGTDRLAECANQLELDDSDIIVNVQGDEPLLPADLINLVADNLARNEGAGIATLAERIHDSATLFNPNAVKVVMDEAGMALYFSRAPIPWARDHFAKDGFSAGDQGFPDNFDYYRHIGIYAYRVGFLRDYVSWGASMLEQIESLEQLRALWHGVKIHVGVVKQAPPPGVDTPEDLETVRKMLAS